MQTAVTPHQGVMLLGLPPFLYSTWSIYGSLLSCPSSGACSGRKCFGAYHLTTTYLEKAHTCPCWQSSEWALVTISYKVPMPWEVMGAMNACHCAIWGVW